MEKKQEEKILQNLEKEMREYGLKCGKEIVKVAKKLHKRRIAIAIPLYRSAVIVLKQSSTEKKEGKLTIILYGDPSWLGKKVDEENLPNFSKRLVLIGDRRIPFLSVMSLETDLR